MKANRSSSETKCALCPDTTCSTRPDICLCATSLFPGEVRTLLCAMPYAETHGACEALREKFIHRYLRFAPKTMERLADDWERLVTFYQFPCESWSHSRTNNIVESPFATMRLRTTTAKCFKKV
jgi:transposase-like protein